MWASVIQALSVFLLGLWKQMANPIGTDVPSNPQVKKDLDDKLAEWEQRTGADKCDLPRRR